VIYLTLGDLLHIAERTLGETPLLRDEGLLASAAARPQTTVFGEDAYPDVHTKAAALLHSIARNRALVDGNKRLGLAGTLVFLGVNGLRLEMTNDEAYDFVIDVAVGRLAEVGDIATVLAEHTGPY